MVVRITSSPSLPLRWTLCNSAALSTEATAFQHGFQPSELWLCHDGDSHTPPSSAFKITVGDRQKLRSTGAYGQGHVADKHQAQDLNPVLWGVAGYQALKKANDLCTKLLLFPLD